MPANQDTVRILIFNQQDLESCGAHLSLSRDRFASTALTV